MPAVQALAISGGLATNPVLSLTGAGGSATSTANKLVLFIGSGQTHPVTAVTDNGTGGANTWTRTVHNSGTLLGDVWETLAANPHSITSVTLTNGGNELVNVAFFELSGAVNTAPLNASAFAQGTTSTAASSGASGTPPDGTTFDLLGMVTWLRSNSTSTQDTGPTFSPAGAGTNVFVDNAGVSGNHWSTRASYASLTSATAQTFSTTVVNPLNWVAIVALVKLKPVISPSGKAVTIGVTLPSVPTRATISASGKALGVSAGSVRAGGIATPSGKVVAASPGSVSRTLALIRSVSGQPVAATSGAPIPRREIENVPISTGSDDGRQSGLSANPVLTDNSILMQGINGAGPNQNTYAAFRFPVNVVQGATILAADLRLFIPSGALTNLDLEIYAEAVDDSAALTTSVNNISGRTRTTAHVNWSTTSTANAYNTSPSLKTVLAEVVNRSGWAPNQHITLIVIANPACLGDIGFYEAGSTTKEPILDVTATPTIQIALTGKTVTASAGAPTTPLYGRASPTGKAVSIVAGAPRAGVRISPSGYSTRITAGRLNNRGVSPTGVSVSANHILQDGLIYSYGPLVGTGSTGNGTTTGNPHFFSPTQICRLEGHVVAPIHNSAGDGYPLIPSGNNITEDSPGSPTAHHSYFAAGLNGPQVEVETAIGTDENIFTNHIFPNTGTGVFTQNSTGAWIGPQANGSTGLAITDLGVSASAHDSALVGLTDLRPTILVSGLLVRRSANLWIWPWTQQLSVYGFGRAVVIGIGSPVPAVPLIVSPSGKTVGCGVGVPSLIKGGVTRTATGKAVATVAGSATPHATSVVPTSGKSVAVVSGTSTPFAGGVTRVTTGRAVATTAGSAVLRATNIIPTTGRSVVTLSGNPSALPGGVTRTITGKTVAAVAGSATAHATNVIPATGKTVATAAGPVTAAAGGVIRTISGRVVSTATGSAVLHATISTATAGRAVATTAGSSSPSVGGVVRTITGKAVATTAGSATPHATNAIQTTGKSVAITGGTLTLLAGGVTRTVTGRAVSITAGAPILRTTGLLITTGTAIATHAGMPTCLAGGVTRTITGKAVHVFSGAATLAAGAVTRVVTGKSISVVKGVPIPLAGGVTRAITGRPVTVSSGPLVALPGIIARTITGKAVAITPGASYASPGRIAVTASGKAIHISTTPPTFLSGGSVVASGVHVTTIGGAPVLTIRIPHAKEHARSIAGNQGTSLRLNRPSERTFIRPRQEPNKVIRPAPVRTRGSE